MMFWMSSTIMEYGITHESRVTHESICNPLLITYRINKYQLLSFYAINMFILIVVFPNGTCVNHESI